MAWDIPATLIKLNIVTHSQKVWFFSIFHAEVNIRRKKTCHHTVSGLRCVPSPHLECCAVIQDNSWLPHELCVCKCHLWNKMQISQHISAAFLITSSSACRFQAVKRKHALGGAVITALPKAMCYFWLDWHNWWIQHSTYINFLN